MVASRDGSGGPGDAGVGGRAAHAQSRIGSVVITSDTTNYQVAARHSGKCLDLDSGRPDPGAPIIQRSCHSGLNQRWQLRLVAADAVGTYQVVAAPTGDCMAVLGDSRADGASVAELPCTRQRDRLWRISEGYRLFEVERGCRPLVS